MHFQALAYESGLIVKSLSPELVLSPQTLEAGLASGKLNATLGDTHAGIGQNRLRELTGDE